MYMMDPLGGLCMTSLLRSFGSQGSELEVQTCQRLHLDLAGGDRSETGSCHQLSQQKSGDESPQRLWASAWTVA